MIVAVHQPNYLPYIGFFNKMKLADVFVIYDDAQFSKRDFHHRNKIRTLNGWNWLSVPVEKAKLINEVRLKNDVKISGMFWSQYHWRQICENYGNAEFFESYASDLKQIYNTSYERLIELNMNLINFLKLSFGIETDIVCSSAFDIVTMSSNKILDLVKAVQGDTYLSGVGGYDYLDISLLEEHGIKVCFQDFKHPIYKQNYHGFFPNMSAIDLLLNVGEKSQKLV